MIPALTASDISPAAQAAARPARNLGPQDWPLTVLSYGAVALIYWMMLLRAVWYAGGQMDYWADSWDQSQYLRSARAFAALGLNPQDHWYPLLYSLTAAPFVRIMPLDPFALPGCLFILAACAGFVRVAARFEVERTIAVALFCVSTLLLPAVVHRWIEPWNTTLSAALIWLALAQACDLICDGFKRPLQAVALGALLGAIPLARPLDLVISAPVALAVVAAAIRRGEAGRVLGWSIVGGMAAILPYLALHLAIYGPHTSTYMQMSAVYGIKLAWLPWKAYVLLVEPLPWFPYGQGILQRCPWLVLGAAGLIATIIGWTGRRAPALMLAAAAGGYAACMLTYVDLLPTGMWAFGNIHYFKWLLPLFALFTLLLARGASVRPRATIAALAIVLVPACIHLTPARVGPHAPARALRFAGVNPHGREVYMARSVVTDRQGTMRNTFEYHQTDHGASVWAIAQKRDFTGDERWLWRTPADVPWPAGTGTLPVASSLPVQVPVERYGTHLSLGLPCWLPPYPCGYASLNPD